MLEFSICRAAWPMPSAVQDGAADATVSKMPLMFAFWNARGAPAEPTPLAMPARERQEVRRTPRCPATGREPSRAWAGATAVQKGGDVSVGMTSISVIGS